MQILDLGELEREASERTGLEDFGDDGYREAAERLFESAAGEARLSALGTQMVRGLALDRLVNRLEIADWERRNPALADARVEAPILLATLPRTGQTAAGWILDRDPANRSLETWFVKRPCPPPRPQHKADDPRLARERALVAAMPRALLDMHLYDAEEPDECHWLLSNDFRIPHEIYSMRVPSYYAWVRDDPGIRDSYAYYQLQLRILQTHLPGTRWVLKNSPHLLYLDALHAVLPDAVFVQIHRDPTKVLASNCRLAVLLRGMASDSVDPHEVGASMLGLLGDYVDRLLAFREKDASRPWIDLRFGDFVADPVTAVERLYDEAGLTLASAARDAMAGWVAAHPRRDLARARPAELAPYGIHVDQARERFAPYCDRFGVELDGI